MLTKRIEEKLNGNYTRMLRAILNKFWKQHLTKQQLYVHLPPIPKTIQVRQTRHAGLCWRRKDELISDFLLWTPRYGRGSVGRRARTYLCHLWSNIGCYLEDLPGAMDDRDGGEIESRESTMSAWLDNYEEDYFLKRSSFTCAAGSFLFIAAKNALSPNSIL